MNKNLNDHKASRSRLQCDKLSDKHRELLTKARNYLLDFTTSLSVPETNGFNQAAFVAYLGMVKELIERINYELEKTSKTN